MKFLLVVLVVMFGVWVWRKNRIEEREDAQEARKSAARPPGSADRGAAATPAIEMVRCQHCGVHCPHGDAVMGRLGVYCSTQHRTLAEP